MDEIDGNLLPIQAIRLNNLRDLFEQSEFKYERDFSETIGISGTYYSLLKKGSEAGGKDIGHKLARNIETKLGLPENWMDNTHKPAVIEA